MQKNIPKSNRKIGKESYRSKKQNRINKVHRNKLKKVRMKK